MNIQENINTFISETKESIAQDTFVKISLGNYKGTAEQLKSIYIKRILIKQVQKLSFTYRYKTRDIVKNHDIEEGIIMIKEALESNFRAATLFTNTADLIFENINPQKCNLRKVAPTMPNTVSLLHDRSKKRLIEPTGQTYLKALKITDEAGNVFKNAQDKYRQINHYVEILGTLIKDLPTEKLKKVVDMGSGKGYLTFALYDYLHHILKVETTVTGVEFRPDMVELCNKIAEDTQFKALSFVEGTIEAYDSTDTNILIALHACDTATDDAIYKGITANADLIVVAPCCHKQIRRAMEKNKVENELAFLTRYGIFLERQAEMVTDGIRAMILEYFGYKTKVFQFISDAHTPKNVLVVGIKNPNATVNKAEILQKLQATKAYFGIDYHHLEQLVGLYQPS